ncbi:MAG: hypothetical protein ACLFTG_02775 [Alphaproteobacteria bacterium]
MPAPPGGADAISCHDPRFACHHTISPLGATFWARLVERTVAPAA